MSKLFPPRHSRNRSNSTSTAVQIRPPLTITTRSSTFTRPRSTSLIELPTPTTAARPPPPPSQNPTMLSVFLSLALRFLPFHPKANPLYSPPASPPSPTLPVPASPRDTDGVWLDSDGHYRKGGSPVSETAVHTPWSYKGGFSAYTPVLFILLLFPISAAVIVFCLSTLPISGSIPRTVSDLAQLGRELQGYSASGPLPMAHVLGVLAVTAVWKHAWSIPGSVLLNVLTGALLSPLPATLLQTALTTLGSLLATLLSTPLAPLLSKLFPRALSLTRTALEGSSDSVSEKPGKKSSAWVRLSVLRLVGVVPWSGINVACGVCNVSIADCALGAFIGTLPWTAVTCQIGDILQSIAKNPSPTSQTLSSVLASPSIIMKLVFLSLLSLGPILGRNRLRALLGGSDETETESEREKVPKVEEEEPARPKRWSWRLSSQMVRRDTELAVLSAEKEKDAQA